MTAEPYYFAHGFTNTIDITDSNIETYGNHAQLDLGTTFAMWSGKCK